MRKNTDDTDRDQIERVPVCMQIKLLSAIWKEAIIKKKRSYVFRSLWEVWEGQMRGKEVEERFKGMGAGGIQGWNR